MASRRRWKTGAAPPSLHDAHHEVMEALGEMVWESQRSGKPFDGQSYIDRVMMRATADLALGLLCLLGAIPRR